MSDDGSWRFPPTPAPTVMGASAADVREHQSLAGAVKDGRRLLIHHNCSISLNAFMRQCCLQLLNGSSDLRVVLVPSTDLGSPFWGDILMKGDRLILRRRGFNQAELFPDDGRALPEFMDIRIPAAELSKLLETLEPAALRLTATAANGDGQSAT